MATILDGKAVSAAVKQEVKTEVEALKQKGISVGLAVIIVGDNPASRTYVNNKKKACAEAGIVSEEYALPESTTQAELLGLIDTLNKKDSITAFSANCRCRSIWTKRRLLPPSTRKKMWTPSTQSMSGTL